MSTFSSVQMDDCLLLQTRARYCTKSRPFTNADNPSVTVMVILGRVKLISKLQLIYSGADMHNQVNAHAYPTACATGIGTLIPLLRTRPMTASSNVIAKACDMKNGKDAPKRDGLTKRSPPQWRKPDMAKPT